MTITLKGREMVPVFYKLEGLEYCKFLTSAEPVLNLPDGATIVDIGRDDIQEAAQA